MPHAESTHTPPQPAPMAWRVVLQSLAHTLEDGLLEREQAARLVLLSALAGEHVLLIGPPGTAKSELARRLQSILPGKAAYFERLLTRFSTPEELFGPLSLKALEEDRYERLVQGYLPTAQVAFLDEVFKANSAILNALLTLLNERLFDNGVQRLSVPLVTVVGASNEMPADEALLAFHDRFLLRVPVEPVGDAAFDALLAPHPARRAPTGAMLEPGLRDAVQRAAAGVALDGSALAGLHSLRRWLQGRGIRVSDRRWRQFGALLRLAAAAEGRPAVAASDLWLAAYVAGAEPVHTAELLQMWQQEILQIGSSDAPGLERTVEAFEKQLEIETRAQAEEGADAAGKMALARSVGGAAGDGPDSQMLRLYSQRVEDRLRKRWSPLHIRARIAQVQEQRGRIGAALAQAQAHLETLQAELLGRLWLARPLADAALQPPRRRVALLQNLAQRLQQLEEGFAALPVDDALADLPTPTPMPVVA